jgi:RNA polymerase sigma factor (TIGR02999 family)
MNDVTQILSAIEQGDTHAADQLFPLVYDALRQLAAAKLAKEAPGQTLQATALVHEAYLKLVESTAQQWNSRGHFFAAAAEAMRRILVDQARKKHSLKRGGDRVRQPLDELNEAKVMAPEVGEDLVVLDAALEQLAARDAEAAEVVKLRFFAGLTAAEAAAALGISPRTADRAWTYARVFLLAELKKSRD